MESSKFSSWPSDGQGSVSKVAAEGGGASSENVDVQANNGGEEGEGSKDRTKLEGKGESYVLTLKVVLPGSSDPISVMVSSTQYREEEGGSVALR